MKCFVTGSTGFIGSTLVRHLLDEGHEVTALARTQEKASKYVDSRAKIVLGDMSDIDAIAPHLSGVDTVFHLAAYFKEYTGADEKDESILQSVNVDAVIKLLNASSTAKVTKFIHTSTIGVIAPKSSGDESAPHATGTSNRYFQSKIRAELAIAEWRKTHAVPSVRMVLPAAVSGPGDNGPTGLGRTVIDVVQGKLPVSPPGAMNIVDVRDVAALFLAVAERGVDGERYIGCAVFKTFAELISEVSDIAKVKGPSIKMPYAMAMLYAGASEMGSKITGVPPLATRVMIKTLVDMSPVNGSKATRELGLQYRSLEVSLRDEIEWFRSNGMA